MNNFNEIYIRFMVWLGAAPPEGYEYLLLNNQEPVSTRYNLKNIRALLTEGFDIEDLRRLCYDVPNFRPVYDKLAQDTSKAQIIDRLIEHAERTLQLNTLLAWAKEHNSARYEKHQPYYEVAAIPTTSDIVQEKSPRSVPSIPGYDPRTMPDRLQPKISRHLSLPPKPFKRLVGREGWVSELMGILRDPAGPPMLSITGIGGIGKTALAYELADRALREQLFVDVAWFSAKQQVIVGRHIRDLDKGLSTYSDVLDSIHRQLLFGTRYASRRDRDAQIYHLLKSRPYLLVVDNLETLQDETVLVESLPDLLQPSRAVLTSRRKLDNVDHVYTSVMSGLDEIYSIELTRQEANDRGVSALASAEDKILYRIHKETGGMPLAIKLVVGEVLSGLAIETVLERLRYATDEEELYRFIYFDLWNTLTDPARQVLVVMPAFASSASNEMLQQVSGLSGTKFDVAIMELVQKSLLDVSEQVAIKQRRYSIHALTRNFIISDLTKIFEDQMRQARLRQ